jgi:hypothetical protein
MFDIGITLPLSAKPFFQKPLVAGYEPTKP